MANACRRPLPLTEDGRRLLMYGDKCCVKYHDKTHTATDISLCLSASHAIDDPAHLAQLSVLPNPCFLTRASPFNLRLYLLHHRWPRHILHKPL